MPRELSIDPAARMRPGRLAFPDIPVHAYATPIADEAHLLNID